MKTYVLRHVHDAHADRPVVPHIPSLVRFHILDIVRWGGRGTSVDLESQIMGES